MLPIIFINYSSDGALVIHSPVSLSAGENFKEEEGCWYSNNDDLIDIFVEGSWNVELAEQIQQEKGDVLLASRQSYNAFTGTGLKEILAENNVGVLFVGGFLTNVCVEQSLFAASEIDNVSFFYLFC